MDTIASYSIHDVIDHLRSDGLAFWILRHIMCSRIFGPGHAKYVTTWNSIRYPARGDDDSGEAYFGRDPGPWWLRGELRAVHVSVSETVCDLQL